MPQDTSFIPPHITPPDPPEAKAVAVVLSIFMTLGMIVFIGVITFNFLAEMAEQHRAVQIPEDIPPERVPGGEFKHHFELITPNHQTQMFGPDIVVIYKRRLPNSSAEPPHLLMDTVKHPWEKQFGNDIWFARLKLSAGLHRAQVEEAEADFFVATSDSSLRCTEPWAWNNPHPGTDDTALCYACHVPLVQGRNETVGVWRGIVSCYECHDEGEQNIRHAAVQPADQCLRCHGIH